jgi:predicted DNA-binding transcriptional regulator AlpA
MTERIHLPQVLALAGYSRTTLRNRQLAGTMPLPIDRGARGGIFDKAAVLKALGMTQDAAPDPTEAWTCDINALRDDLARKVRRPQEARGRHQQGILSGSGTSASLRLVSGHTAAPHG